MSATKEGTPLSPERQIVINELASIISSYELHHPLRVAIDGVDTSGKTTLANELVKPLEALGKPVIRASIDRFYRPREERYKRGKDSPEGYYLDSFNHEALIHHLLIPLGEDGSKTYRPAHFDFRTDTPIQSNASIAADNAILLFDGIFLLRPELFDYWDLRIFLQIPFHEVITRAKARDLQLFGGEAEVEGRYKKRYIPGQHIYLETVRPEAIADIVIDNTDYTSPSFVPQTSFSQKKH